jgi:integral membrane sensor domain MASE1
VETLRQPAGNFSRLPYLAQLAILAFLYFMAGKINVVLPSRNGPIWLLWPPTGLALAGLIVGGARLWPAIGLASFALNCATSPIATAMIMAAGNTLQALVGLWLVRRGEFRLSLDRVEDMIRLVQAGLLAPLVGATVGVAVRSLDGAQAWGDWLPWWLSNVMSLLVVTPLLLTWSAPPAHDSAAGGWLTVAGLLLTLAGVSGGILCWPFRGESVSYPLAFGVFPLLVWSALRFGPRGAATSSFVVVAVAVLVTYAGADTPVHWERLAVLQGFLGMSAVTALALAAAMGIGRLACAALPPPTQRAPGMGDDVTGALASANLAADVARRGLSIRRQEDEPCARSASSTRSGPTTGRLISRPSCPRSGRSASIRRRTSRSHSPRCRQRTPGSLPLGASMSFRAASSSALSWQELSLRSRSCCCSTSPRRVSTRRRGTSYGIASTG